MFTLIAPTYIALHLFRQMLITLNLYLYLLYISRLYLCTHISPSILFIYVARQFALHPPKHSKFTVPSLMELPNPNVQMGPPLTPL